MLVKNALFATLFVGSAYAQSTPLPTSSISTCVLTCAQSSTLCSFTDASCVCVNAAYQQAVLSCLQSQCTPADVTQAEAIEAALCSSSSVYSSASSSINEPSTSVLHFPSPSNTNSSGGNNSGGVSSLSTTIITAGAAVLLGVVGGGMLVF